MTIHDYVRVLRKRWRVLVVCVLIATGTAGAIVWRTTPKYEATTQLFVAATDLSSDLSGLAQGGQFTQERVQSYANIIDSLQVTGPVAAQAGDGLTAAQITNEVSASAPPNTVLVNVHLTDTSAKRAQALADAVSDQFAQYADQLETTPGSASSPVKVTVVKRAQLPTRPVSPKKTLDLVLGLLVGLSVGVGGVLLRETLDTSVKDLRQIQDDFGLPVLGAIAYDPDAKPRPLVVQADPHSTRAEAFRQLRTNLQFLDVDHSPRSLVFSSSIPEEGKTTTATNLAITMAQSGLRVVVVEADLRRPRLATYLGLDGAVGLTSVLVGTASLEDALQPWGDGQLDVLASGPTPPNPSELLGSHGMASVIQRLEQQYDFVLIDAPPLLPVTDAAVVATIASGAVLIVHHGHTRQKQLAQAVAALRSVDVTVYGVVLTMVPTKGPDAYYYGYNYRYDQAAADGRSRGSASDVAAPIHSADANDAPPTNRLASINGAAATRDTDILRQGPMAPGGSDPRRSVAASLVPSPAKSERETDPLEFFLT